MSDPSPAPLIAPTAEQIALVLRMCRSAPGVSVRLTEARIDALDAVLAHLDAQAIEIARMREALTAADSAMNPPDRAGISLHEWNSRLKAATHTVRAALTGT